MGVKCNLLNILKFRGMKPADLARQSGVSTARISEIVTGKTLNPQMKTLIKIAQALDISLEDLTSDAPLQGEALADRSQLTPTQQVLTKEPGTRPVNKQTRIPWKNEQQQPPSPAPTDPKLAEIFELLKSYAPPAYLDEIRERLLKIKALSGK